MDLDEFKRYFDTKFNELNKKVNDSRQKAPLSLKKKGTSNIVIITLYVYKLGRSI